MSGNVTQDDDTLDGNNSLGVLVLTAPKKENLPPATQPIAIIQGEAPALPDVDEAKKSGEIEDEEKKGGEMEP
jgi:hypothetical protein